MALAAQPGLGPVQIRQLDSLGDGCLEALLEMEQSGLAALLGPAKAKALEDWRRHFDPPRVAEELERIGADFLTCEDPGYPEGLAPFSDRPVGLYRCRAQTPFPERCLAIVGTRQPTGYGRGIARLFGAELSRAGFAIISGLAEGIDTEAHRAALSAGGRTAAVLGGGLNRLYPASNRDLMREIADSAGVWTEFPLWRKADRRTFPQRNRIVSGVSEGVVVIESGAKGGSLITARLASEQGKAVYVVPGRIDSPVSDGCHALIRDGAQLVTSAEDVLEDLAYLPAPLRAGGRPRAPTKVANATSQPELEGNSARVRNLLLERGPVHPDTIALDLEIPLPDTSRLLLELELRGILMRRLDGRYEAGTA